MKKEIILVLMLFINTLLCFSQTLNINIPDNQFQIDDTNLLIVSHIENIESYNNLSNYTEINLFLNQNIYSFVTLPNSLEYSDSYTLSNQTNQFTLYFTQLPIISIETENEIPDEPKVHANFVYADDEQIVVSNIGIELRGGSSLSYPKKTFGIEFWEDVNGVTTHNVSFANMRNDDDWILDALYNEPLRIRSYTANKLWLDMNSLYYQNEEPNARAGIDVEYVEVFLNKKYNGLYNLSELIDRKQLELKSFNGEIRGELYKGISWGASTFTALPSFDNSSRIWSGYEYKYPKESDATDWQRLYDFTDFVMYASDTDFEINIWNKFNYNNFLDYFIFLNLIRATDNTGKNIYVSNYKANEPYFYIPWDLDGCFGTIWNGTNDNTTNDILANGFYNRIIDLNTNDYNLAIGDKWNSFRLNVLDYINLENRILDSYNFFYDNKIYERESLVYPNYSFDEESLDYLRSWLQNRLYYLDMYFNNSLSIINVEPKSSIFLYPNPASEKIYLKEIESVKSKYFVIFNLGGSIIKTGCIHSNFIPVSDIKNGTYLIQIDKKAYKFILQ